MIISASYKTDIPAFYGEWFTNRLRAGFCSVVNPFNRRSKRVPLDRSTVDGFVFWTKNIGPFLSPLRTVADLGYPFVVQYTINGYPRELESQVTDSERSLKHIKELSRSYGRDSVVWRYDPILTSTLTPLDSHVDRFQSFAQVLESYVDEVVISFVHLYKKTKSNLNHAARNSGFSWSTPSSLERKELVERLLTISNEHGMALAICSQPENLVPGAQPARCIDAARIQRVGDRCFSSSIKGNRPGCECSQATDIGDYDTCAQGCVYCYAVRSWDLAKKRYARHDPESEYLNPDWATLPSREVRSDQLPLFHPPQRHS